MLECLTLHSLLFADPGRRADQGCGHETRQPCAPRPSVCTKVLAPPPSLTSPRSVSCHGHRVAGPVRVVERGPLGAVRPPPRPTARVPRLAQKLTRSAARPCRMIEAKKPLKVSRLPEHDTRNFVHHLTLRPLPPVSFRRSLRASLRPPPTSRSARRSRPSSRRASVRWSTTLTTRRASCRWYAARPNSILAATASHTLVSPAQALAVKYNFLSK